MTEMNPIYDPEAMGLEVTGWSGDERYCRCPFHDDSSQSASYNVVKDILHCYACGVNKNGRQIAEQTGGVLVVVADRGVGIDVEEGRDLEWRAWLKNKSAAGSTYLSNRLVAHRFCEEFGILQNERGIIFPIRDKKGRETGVQVRFFEDMPKYKIYGEKQPIWPYSELFSAMRETTNTHLIVTEGVFGALRLKSLFPELNAVATMGSGGAEEAAKILKVTEGTRVKPLIYMDSDYAGLLASGKFALMGFSVILNKIPADEVELTADLKKVLWRHTNDVNEIIEYSEEPSKLNRALRKFYRRIENGEI